MNRVFAKKQVWRNLQLNRTSFVLVLAALFVPPAISSAGQNRWYSNDQLVVGKGLYASNCTNCHGKNGESTENWRQTNDQGKYPPPPLNGTAHTWHHSMEVLRRTLRDGGGKIGGSMPAFRDVLDSEEIDAVIAYVQSLWPDEIYDIWTKANPEYIAANTANQPTEKLKSESTTHLAKLLPPGAQISEPVETPVNGIYEVNANGRFIYLDGTGKYAFTGDMINLGTGENLTDAKRAIDRVSKLSGFPEKDKIVFSATGEQYAYIDVFTDTTCPYCRKLHAEVPDLQAAGVTVRYLPFPRGGKGSQGDQELRAVWCDADRVQSMHLAKTESTIPANDGACDAADVVDAGYQLGVDIGVRGTPAIVLPDGTMIPGYRPHRDLISILGVENN